MVESSFTATIGIKCDCGHEYKIPIIGLNAETELICPACGDIDQIDADQIASIHQEYERKLGQAGNAALADSVNELRAELGETNALLRYALGKTTAQETAIGFLVDFALSDGDRRAWSRSLRNVADVIGENPNIHTPLIVSALRSMADEAK